MGQGVRDHEADRRYCARPPTHSGARSPDTSYGLDDANGGLAKVGSAPTTDCSCSAPVANSRLKRTRAALDDWLVPAQMVAAEIDQRLGSTSGLVAPRHDIVVVRTTRHSDRSAGMRGAAWRIGASRHFAGTGALLASLPEPRQAGLRPVGLRSTCRVSCVALLINADLLLTRAFHAGQIVILSLTSRYQTSFIAIV